MADIIGATTGLISSIGTSVSEAASSIMESGPVSGLSNALGSLGSSLGGLGKSQTVTKLPIPNPLSSYASYNYVLTLSAMSFKDINFPDSSYKSGKVLPIVCASGSKDPKNRIQTQFGKFEFYMDNLKFETAIGLNNPKATNVTTVQFDVFEPYSLGLFVLALQTAAKKQGWANWRDAPFLLTIEFRGNKETGEMKTIPNTVRHIPVKFTTILFKANEQGSSYAINAYATQGQALTVEHASLKTDMTIRGKTVQEVLQTGEQSLQAVINKKLQEAVDNKERKVADQIIILFPNDIASVSMGNASAATNAKGTTATVNPVLQTDTSSVFTKLGVVQSSVNQTYVQQDGQVNLLGSSSMGYDLSRMGDPTTKDETAVLKNGVWTRGDIISNPAEGSLRFAQNADIPTVITTALMMSDYPKKALDSTNEDKDGMKTWWRVDTQVYYIDTKENLSSMGTVPKVLVYRVIPYKAHSSRQPSSNQPAKGLSNLKKQVVKSYDYIFTGKNTEIINFNLDFSVSFSNILAADGLRNSGDVVNSKASGVQDKKVQTVNQNPKGVAPSDKPGVGNTSSKQSGTEFSMDRKGGGGTDTYITRAAKVWHDAITNPLDMINLNLDIYGDPYWIANSGMGNYTSKPSKVSKDLNEDGTVNWQTSEVDIHINFKNPLDINQSTGLYDFKTGGYNGGSGPSTDGAIGFKGLYHITTITNSFRQGEFRQSLHGYRRKLQESNIAPVAQTGVSTDVPDPKDSPPEKRTPEEIKASKDLGNFNG
jgi:hypothetical protein